MITKLLAFIRWATTPKPSELELRLLAILERQEAELANEFTRAAKPGHILPLGDDRS